MRGIVHPPMAKGRFRESRLRMPSDERTRAYLAGLFDGEGCIHRQKNQRAWYLQVGMTDETTVRWLESFGGTVRYREPATENHRPQWLWKLMAQLEVEEMLVALMPYLRLKREPAAAAVHDIRQRHNVRAALAAEGLL